jgi:hypothetical protein
VQWAAAAPRIHSRPGIASFVIGLAVILGNIALVILAAVLSQQPQSQKSPAMIAVGLLLIAGMGISLIGIALGVVGIVQRDRRKALAILGLCLNGGMLLLIEALMFIGMRMKK